MEGCGDLGSKTLDFGDTNHTIVEMESSNEERNNVGLDIGCITNEFSSQTEIEKYVTNGNTQLLKHSQKTPVTEMQRLPSVQCT